ncbi:PcfJ domain-containing protein [Clostridium sp. CX1]|uniref:PcfJ domain-containing protein n=1 Tax=Clostridium sp. CX1 TaxID=2978346 RepID=UPI0021C1B425|nr:PcfJ domain-containing protein [Clostridium sp. CX1]MCT8975520.1 PcfJ domain-containing protein [Clostridium sp. CX1]
MYEEYTSHISKEITEKIEKFVDDEVFGEREYLFIEKVNGIYQGHCTKCHKEYELSQNYKHNASGICPQCGANLQVKQSRYGRKNCRNDACFYYFEKSIKNPSAVVCKGYYVSRDYTADYKNPVTEFLLEAIYIFEDKKSKMLKFNNSYFQGARWDEKKSVFDFNQGWFAPKMCYISRESIEEATKDTRFQYIPKELLQGYHSTVKVFDEFTKYPWLEQLYKMGFKDIVETKIKGGQMHNCLNYRGKDIFKVLRLPRKDVKDIINSNKNITPFFLSLYQLQVKDKSILSPKEVKEIEIEYQFYFEKLKHILKYTSMRKAVKYIEKQYEKYKKHYVAKGSVTTTWSDYIENCIDLEMDLNSDHVLYPKDVYKLHQNTMKQVKVKADKISNEKISRRVGALNEKYYFKYKDLVIRAAEGTEELILEGKTLNHCVATNYIKPYAKGETNIFLLRKISEPDKPYYTVEIKDDEIRQVHGKRNCMPDEEVKMFIEVFKAEKLGKKKIKISVPA